MARSKLTLLAAGAALAFALAGCTAAPIASNTPTPTPTASEEPSTEQSTAEACETLQEAAAEPASELQTAFGEAQTNPAAAIAKLEALVTALDGAVSEVTNEEVRAVGEGARDSIQTMVDYIQGLIANPAGYDAAAFQEILIGVQDAFIAVGEVCG